MDTDHLQQKLHDLCKSNETKCLKRILDKTKNVKTVLNKPLPVKDSIKEDETTTLLCEACENGSFECVEILIQKGADVSLAASSGATPLQCACRTKKDKTEKAKLLLKQEETDLTKSDNLGNNVIHTASFKGNIEALELILSSLEQKKPSLLNRMINAMNSNGYSPLTVAAMTGQDHCILLLKKYGAKLTVCTEQGYTPVMAAARWNQPTCIVALLRNEQCDTWQSYHASGDTPLHYAARYGALEAAQVLVSQGARLDIRNKEGKTPSDLANPHIKEFLEDKRKHTADIALRYMPRRVELCLKPTLEPDEVDSGTEPHPDESTTDGGVSVETFSTMPSSILRKKARRGLKTHVPTRQPSFLNFPAPPPPGLLKSAKAQTPTRETEEPDGPISSDETFVKQVARKGIQESDPYLLLSGSTTLKSQDNKSHDISPPQIPLPVEQSSLSVPKPRPKPKAPPRRNNKVATESSWTSSSESNFASNFTIPRANQAIPSSSSFPQMPRFDQEHYAVQHPHSRTLPPSLETGSFEPSTLQVRGNVSCPSLNLRSTDGADLALRLVTEIEQVQKEQHNLGISQTAAKSTSDSKFHELELKINELKEQLQFLLRRSPVPMQTTTLPNPANPSLDHSILADAVQNLMPELIEMNVDPHIINLFSQKFLTLDDCDRLQAQPVSRDKAKTFVYTLLRKHKDVKWAPAFVESLQNSEEEGDKILGDKILLQAQKIRLSENQT